MWYTIGRVECDTLCSYCQERFKKLLRLYPDVTLKGRLRHSLLCKDVRAIRDDLSLACPGLKHINLSQNEVLHPSVPVLCSFLFLQVLCGYIVWLSCSSKWNSSTENLYCSFMGCCSQEALPMMHACNSAAG